MEPNKKVDLNLTLRNLRQTNVIIVCKLADVVIVELPQTPEDDIGSARAMRGRWTSYSQLMYVCS